VWEPKKVFHIIQEDNTKHSQAGYEREIELKISALLLHYILRLWSASHWNSTERRWRRVQKQAMRFIYSTNVAEAASICVYKSARVMSSIQ
jgi:hypothetical protein